MKVIQKGNQRINCTQCGSELEYEWEDIVEYREHTYCVICPICGRPLEVSECISMPYAGLLSGKTITVPYDYPGTRYPFEVFPRDTIYTSNIVGSVGEATISCTNAKADDATTLTATI